MSKIKTKGLFVTGYDDTTHNANEAIVVKAVIKYFSENKPIAETVNECNDIRDFVIIRTVKTGGVFRDNYFGKVARFYYSTASKDALRYSSSNNLVPKSNNSMLLLNLTNTLPS